MYKQLIECKIHVIFKEKKKQTGLNNNHMKNYKEYIFLYMRKVQGKISYKNAEPTNNEFNIFFVK